MTFTKWEWLKIILQTSNRFFMNATNKVLVGMLLGVAATSAVMMFFNSDKGKALIADVQETAENFGNDIKNKWASVDEELNTLLQKGKCFISSMEGDKEAMS